MELSDDENEGGREIGNSGDEAREEPSGQNVDEEGVEGRRIDPATSRKRIVRNPQPKLNAERIQGPKGIQTIEGCFEGFKFRGKGYEKGDLDRVMKRMEHWAHRLFPKYRFGDFLEKMETLGSKKNVQVFIKKYRLGMVRPDDETVDAQPEIEENAKDNPEQEDTPVDEFDKLLAEEIEKKRRVSDATAKTLNESTGRVLGSASTAKPSELTEEIKARIERNKKLAMERKMARLRREEDSKKRKLEESLVGSATEKFVEVSHTKESRNVAKVSANVKSTTDSVPREMDERGRDFDRGEQDQQLKRAKTQPKAPDLSEKPLHIAQVEEVPQIINQTRKEYDQKKNAEEPLTRDELLMEIEGAMEEIINKSTRRST